MFAEWESTAEGPQVGCDFRVWTLSVTAHCPSKSLRPPHGAGGDKQANKQWPQNVVLATLSDPRVSDAASELRWEGMHSAWPGSLLWHWWRRALTSGLPVTSALASERRKSRKAEIRRKRRVNQPKRSREGSRQEDAEGRCLLMAHELRLCCVSPGFCVSVSQAVCL